MRPIQERKPKKKYYIIHDGEMVGESFAVSPEKAVTNWWWKHVKHEDEFSIRTYGPEELDAVEA